MRSADPAPAAREVAAGAVAVRPLRTAEDYAACLQLQDETWGAQFSERVPAAILKVAQRIGGVAAGAFDPDGRLLGFVFGMTGVQDGHLVHWSDMLAVREGLRDAGIGRRLKEFQRDAVRRLGVTTILWTYDPLVARNAHLNFNRLGVHVTEYVRDMYGADTDSALHRGLGTDRFVVAWPVAEDGDARTVRDVLARLPAAADAPLANGESSADRAATPLVRVEIPPDIHAVQAASLEQAAAWRADTRRAFEHFLARGYAVTGFYRDRDSGRCFYVLHSAATDDERWQV
jgi:predicted GNAT superfamily acetyltransferase